jgi:hypothetical protein
VTVTRFDSKAETLLLLIIADSNPDQTLNDEMNSDPPGIPSTNFTMNRENHLGTSTNVRFPFSFPELLTVLNIARN